MTMSYQVLARKWRPKAFGEVIGQQHVLQALINALNNNRLHHAYLFSGTRGVGKTTLARIFAKSLNCDKGITSEPCGTCGACVAIDEGRFVDLIEVDAASRTKVEDTRELLENVQYAPSQGRFKVYLIDEVHMLSNHSFNALLKTLEEPPEHVKFLLATTDPHKLPVTVLSRCLQLNLMNMTPAHIVSHLNDILAKEAVSFTPESLWQIARAADGSMRDALSLTDQAIAYTDGALTDALITAMLGGIDRGQILSLLHCLSDRNAAGLLAEIEQLSRFSPDFHHMLTELLTTLHRVAIAQIAPDALENDFGDRDVIVAIAQKNTAEDIQLFYQIGMLARKDLPYAPDARSGFEMALLRMMVFSPEATVGDLPPMPPTQAVDGSTSTMPTPRQASQELSGGAQPTQPEPQTVPVDEQKSIAVVAPTNLDAGEIIGNPAAAMTQTVVAEQKAVTEDTALLSSPSRESVPEVSASVANTIDIQPAGQGQPAPEISAVDLPPWDVVPANPVPSIATQPAEVATPDIVPAYSEMPEASEAAEAAEAAETTSTPSTAFLSSETQVSPEIATPAETIPQPPVNEDIGNQEAINAAPFRLDKSQWASQFWTIGLDGMTESIFGNACLEGFDAGCLSLLVDQDYEALFSESHSDKLQQRLQPLVMDLNRVSVRFGAPNQETPFMLRARVKEEQRVSAVSILKADPFVQQLEQSFGARLDEGSVKPRLH